jgi:hypothetical protein
MANTRPYSNPMHPRFIHHNADIITLELWKTIILIILIILIYSFTPNVIYVTPSVIHVTAVSFDIGGAIKSVAGLGLCTGGN